jgi:hypothetical protein
MALGIVSFALLFSLVSIYLKSRLSRLARQRQSEGLDASTVSFGSTGVPEDIQKAVLRAVQRAIGREDFPVRAEDNLSKVYGIVEDDVYDLVVEAGTATGRKPPSPPEFDLRKVVSVADLARFIAQLPEKQVVAP